MVFEYLALLGRILLVGYERIIVKQLGEKSCSVCATFLLFFVSSLLMLPFLFFAKAPPNYYFLIYVAFSSIILAAAFVFYVRSLSIGEASMVSPLYDFNVFFLLILTAIFLGESITLWKILGLLLLVIGASFLNRQKNILSSLKSLFTNKACLLMIFCSVLTAVGRTIDGFVVREISPIVYGFSVLAGISFWLFIYMIFSGKMKNIKPLLKKKKKEIVIAGAVNAFAYLCLLFAFTFIDVNVAVPISMLGMIVTLLLAKIIFKEKIGYRFIGVLIMIAGAWLLFL